MAKVIYLLDHAGWLRNGRPTDEFPDAPHDCLEEEIWETHEGAEAACAKLMALVDADGLSQSVRVVEEEAHEDFHHALELLNESPAFVDTPAEWSVQHRATHIHNRAEGRERAIVNAARRLLA